MFLEETPLSEFTIEKARNEAMAAMQDERERRGLPLDDQRDTRSIRGDVDCLALSGSAVLSVLTGALQAKIQNASGKETENDRALAHVDLAGLEAAASVLGIEVDQALTRQSVAEVERSFQSARPKGFAEFMKSMPQNIPSPQVLGGSIKEESTGCTAAGNNPRAKLDAARRAADQAVQEFCTKSRIPFHGHLANNGRTVVNGRLHMVSDGMESFGIDSLAENMAIVENSGFYSRDKVLKAQMAVIGLNAGLPYLMTIPDWHKAVEEKKNEIFAQSAVERADALKVREEQVLQDPILSERREVRRQKRLNPQDDEDFETMLMVREAEGPALDQYDRRWQKEENLGEGFQPPQTPPPVSREDFIRIVAGQARDALDQAKRPHLRHAFPAMAALLDAQKASFLPEMKRYAEGWDGLSDIEDYAKNELVTMKTAFRAAAQEIMNRVMEEIHGPDVGLESVPDVISTDKPKPLEPAA